MLTDLNLILFEVFFNFNKTLINFVIACFFLHNICLCYPQMDINEMTRPWGLEVDRVELTFGSLIKAPEESSAPSYAAPPSVPGLEGLTSSIQHMAMHFLSQGGSSQLHQSKAEPSQPPFYGE